MSQIAPAKTSVLSQVCGKAPRVNALGLLLRALLIFAVIWLPMTEFAAGMFSESGFTAKGDLVKGMSRHQHGIDSTKHYQTRKGSALSAAYVIHTAMDPSMSVSMSSPMSDCSAHHASCCHAGVSFCSSLAGVPIPMILPAVDRYQHFTDSLTVVVLARDTRPPIV